MLLLGSIRSIMRICIRIDNVFFRKPTRPSLPLRKLHLSSRSSPLRKKRETALLGAQNRFALRLADHQRSSHGCAGWDRLDGITTSCYNGLIKYSF